MEHTESALNVLGLPPDASPSQINSAYHELVQVWHPDRFSYDKLLQAKANQKMQEINAAYEFLRRSPPPRSSGPAPSQAPLSRLVSHSFFWPIVSRLAFLAAFLLLPAVGYFLFMHFYGPKRSAFSEEALAEYASRRSNGAEAARRKPGASGLAEEIEMIQALLKQSGSSGAELPPGLAEMLMPTPQAGPAAQDPAPSDEKGRAKPQRLPSKRAPATFDYYSVGSPREAVLAIEGRPDSESAESLNYGDSKVWLQKGFVVRWETGKRPLKAIWPFDQPKASR